MRVCLLSYALPIETDPRTGRQVEALLLDHEVIGIGFGTPTQVSLTWKAIDMATPRWRRLLEMALLALGKLIPAAYDLYYWTRPRYRQGYAAALAAAADVYHASDWGVLPIAVQTAKAHGAKVVYDIDEYWPLFEESSRLWAIFFGPLVRHVERRCCPQVDRAMSVSPAFSALYRADHGLESILVYNAPPLQAVPAHATDPAHIRLIHHGAAQPDRKLETLIDMMPLLDARFTLDFLLGGGSADYLAALKARAEAVAPGRVFFRAPVGYEAVVQTIADCDIEVAFMAPTTFTWLNTLPNKIFEAMMAGLAVLVGPSPAMAAVVQEQGAGWVADGFDAPSLARALNGLTAEAITQRREAARAAAERINAGTEREKLRALYRELAGGPTGGPG